MERIFCYSGTGNCFASAKQLASELGMEVVHITDELAKSKSTFGGEVGIVIYPVYAYGMPKTVKRFILNNNFKFGYLAVLTSFGSSAGGAYAEAIKLFKKRKQRVSYTNGTVAVENYVHMFKLPPTERIKELTKIQEENTKLLANDIRKRQTNKRFLFRPESVFVSFVFRKFTSAFAKRYKVTDKCTHCKICYRVCPAAAIEPVTADTKPKFIPKKCDHCQACMQLCPAHAICFAKIQPESRRYLHSNVKVDELFKR